MFRMGSKEEFVFFIKEELTIRNWSNAELAKRSGISQAHISRVLNSDYLPGIDLLKSFSHALNVPVEQLFRLAGLLPEKKELEPEKERMLHLFSQLEHKEKQLILDFLEFLTNRNNT